MFNLIIGLLNDIIIISGTALTTAMLATGQVQMPSKPVILYTLLMGVVQGVRRWQSKTGPSPVKEEAPVVVRTAVQLAREAKGNEDVAALITDAVKRALPKTPVTAQRVPDPPPPKPTPEPGSVL